MARMHAPRGTEDLFSDRIPSFEHVFDAFRTIAERCGYREIRTPLFEDTRLFERSLGDVTDVVEKEMFTVARGDASVSFRPEGTAPVVRAYLEANLDKIRPFQKFYYVGPMFRFERPQAGRQRQFDQCGVEALGSSSPLLDAEVIGVAMDAFQRMGLERYELHLNSIGDRGDREAFRELLREHFRPLLDQRCDDCRRRFERNVFRMLDCKVEGCQPSNAAAPHFVDHLAEPSRVRFERTLEALDALRLSYQIDHSIVRGFDYYTHTVYEIQCPDLGARSAICGGGRYDSLIADTGGPELGATGFAIGVTPTMLALARQQHPAMEPRESRMPIFIAAVGDAERPAAFALLARLRAAGLTADTDFEDRSLRSLFKAADRRGVRLMLILGEAELAAGRVKLKDLASGDEVELPADETLAGVLQARLDAERRI